MNREELILAGMDVNDFMIRIMNNEKLVRMFVNKFLEDKTYESLMSALAAGDMKNAELSCHTLKGVCGNLSLNELFNLLQTQLKYFRSGDYVKAEEMMEQISALYEKAVKHMRKWLAE